MEQTTHFCSANGYGASAAQVGARDGDLRSTNDAALIRSDARDRGLTWTPARKEHSEVRTVDQTITVQIRCDGRWILSARAPIGKDRAKICAIDDPVAGQVTRALS